MCHPFWVRSGGGEVELVRQPKPIAVQRGCMFNQEVQPMFSPADPRSNRLLAALIDAGCCHAIRPEPVNWRAGQSLYEPGSTQSHVYFPSDTVVSLQYVLDSGASSEFAAVGNQGMVGVSLLLGGTSMPSRAAVQSAGHGFQIGAQTIRDEFERPGPIRNFLLRYMQALLTQTAQSAVCNRHHVVEQQLCRLLLERLDRLPSDRLAMTQEQMAQLLGVRRESVTHAAARLQEAGLIRCGRGHIEVLDRKGLERRSCECYAAVKREYDRLLPELFTTPREPGPTVRQRTERCSMAHGCLERVSAV
jgi:CRP-like cAMP-binding protein